MAAITLGLYLVFLLTAFGLRSYLHYRRTGSTGFHGLSGRTGSTEWWGGVLFVLATALGLTGPILQLADTIDPVAALDTTVLHVGGLLLAIAGIAGTLAAQHAMGASWRVGVDRHETTQLVVDGPFAIVRNPIFTTMITAGFGLTLLAPNPIALLGFVALIAAIEIQVRFVEEPCLLHAHGQTYRDYASSVGRFLPGLGRMPMLIDETR